MNNSDMPAMPTQNNGGDIYGGLTKLEYAAIHMQVDSKTLHEKALSLANGRGFRTVDYVDLIEAEAEIRKHKAKALFEQLES